MSSVINTATHYALAEHRTNNWPVMLGLFLILAIPGIPAIFIVGSVVIGVNVGELPIEFVNKIYLSQPWPVIVHGVSGVLFFLATPLQFSHALRCKYPKWHKYAGYLVFSSGYIMALSAVWMHHVLSPNDKGPRYIGLVIMAFGMCVAFSMALRRVLQSNIESHRAWVIRALAITLGAITYLFVELVVSLTLSNLESLKGGLGPILNEYGRITAVVLNLVIAERIIKRRHRKI